MATGFTQTDRSLAVHTPLGADKLLLAGFRGTEEISDLFQFELEMWSEDFDIAPQAIVGKNITVEVRPAGGTPRYYNGHVRRFSKGERRDTIMLYRAEVVPWLWFLTRTSDCKIFQDKAVPDIIREVFAEYGFADYELTLSGSHPTLEYCVQYRETDFNFVSRLMEREGIFYFFQHANGQHTMVLADSPSVFQPNPQKEVEAVYQTPRDSVHNHINVWEHRYEYRSGKWSQTDYNFIDFPPGTAASHASHLMTDASTVLPLDKIASYEHYDYPGDYEKKPDGTTYTKLRMEEDETPYHVVAGGGLCQAFEPGSKITMTKHDVPSEVGKTYVLTSVSHEAIEKDDYRLTLPSDIARTSYSNRFTCIPEDVPLRPPRKTPRPKVRGAQTAVVTGPAGEEIWPDKYSRVKVQFNWDRIGVRDDKSSCWVRVAQPSAGKGWGSMYIPRIGQEVVVSFLEGDPDRPLITGVVYNAEQMPAYALPAEKTKSYVKTNSSKGGEGYNEIRFEDLAGNEQIFVHAQKNMDIRVLNDRMEHVINDRHLIVGKDGKGSQFEQVQKDKHLNVKGNHVEHIEQDVQWTADGNVDLLTKKKKTESIEGDHDFHLKGQQKQKIDKSASRQIGMNLQEKVGQNTAHESGMNVYIKGGVNVVIEAGVSLTLKVGGSFINLSPASVAIQGAMVMINSGGAAGAGSPPQVVPPNDAEPAQPTEPTDADDSVTGTKSAPDSLS